MTKKNIFNSSDYAEIKGRIASLSETNLRQWGSMNLRQMLAHCIVALKNALGQSKLPLTGNRIMAIGAKWVGVYMMNEFPKGLPTSPMMNATKGQLKLMAFKPEQDELLQLLQQVYQLDANASFGLHPLFRKMTRKQWGRIIYMHLDHHLRQFSG